jgi:predicted nicotinamide N-methyase
MEKQAQGLRAQGTGDGTAFSVWTSALVLSEYLAASHQLPAGPHVELGSGRGLCGLTLAKLGVDVSRPTTSPDLVYCTDGDPEVFSLITSAATANGVDHVVQTATLEWGNRRQVDELLARLDGKPPSLMVGADLLYDVEAIPALVDTLVRLGGLRTILAFPPRHLLPAVGAVGQSCRELDSLVQHAGRHGLCVERRQQHGDILSSCVLIVEVLSEKS